ncbi:ATPase [Parashewanella spongiae]|uniref:ATPase n=2 Tax=Parashewanella spongiae TaxID=342950 RepID=A0A3A6TUX4_9GAMM|nr:ATPase [Parashewanella spongiae]
MLESATGMTKAPRSKLYRELMQNRGDTDIITYGRQIWSANSTEDEQEAVIIEDEESQLETQINDDNCSTLNAILYGSPGTGKTYSTINHALKIIEPEFYEQHKHDREALKNQFDKQLKANRIGFVTFHQSFSYEDFIEGLRANSDNLGQLTYQIEDGIFKRMCNAAKAKPQLSLSQKRVDIAGKKIWKMSLGNTLGDEGGIYHQCIENNYVLLGYGKNIDFTSCNTRKDVINKYRSENVNIREDKESTDYGVTSVFHFKSEMNIGDLIVISDGNQKFRAIAEVTSDYEYDPYAIENGHYAQKRRVIWHRVYEYSLPAEELFDRSISQMTLYRLRTPTINLDKLQHLLKGNELATKKVIVEPGYQFKGYKVQAITDEEIMIIKPNGSHLPISRSIVHELLNLVRQKIITIKDIADKKVFDRVHIPLEKYLINGYPNVLAPLVEGIINYGIANEVTSNSEKRVLIIDEINRGNIANIFGELITLIEPSKRAGGKESLTVKLPYSKEPFSVPSNLYIIGTMNTADKSLAQLDIALRRRFKFIEMMPDYTVLKDIKVDEINISKMLETINKRIELLYDREHTIGHSFLLPLKTESTIEKLAEIFELEIIPLLEEYFFEDWERVSQVLGDHLKPNKSDLRFINEKFSEEEIELLLGDELDKHGIQRFERNNKALSQPQAYIGIYNPNAETTE